MKSTAVPASLAGIAPRSLRQAWPPLAAYRSGASCGAIAAGHRAAFRLRHTLARRLQVPQACDARKVFPDLQIDCDAKQADQSEEGCHEPPVQHMLTHCLPSPHPQTGRRRQPFDVAKRISRAGVVTKRRSRIEDRQLSAGTGFGLPSPSSATMTKSAWVTFSSRSER